ncbi:hypothetical protein [Glutamicibacter arilaitensis]|uniref:hypothetical protein n=1 Tax=Glutamicibacter arilaitensis TaxID=256701 RepID=UPI00384B02FD
MPIVTGNVFDLRSLPMPNAVPNVIFHLEPVTNVTAAGSGKGNVYPTTEYPVVPESSGAFQVNLTATSGFHFDSWYDVELVWNTPAGTLRDRTLRIKVPSGGPHNLGDLIDRTSGGGGSANPMVWWFGLDPPPSGATIWNYLDPDDPDRETGPHPNFIIGDIITDWWEA